MLVKMSLKVCAWLRSKSEPIRIMSALADRDSQKLQKPDHPSVYIISFELPGTRLLAAHPSRRVCVFFFFFFLPSQTALTQCLTRQPTTDKSKISVVSLDIVQELCESRGGRPGLSLLTSLLVSVDVKIYCTVLRHWSQLVPNMSYDI